MNQVNQHIIDRNKLFSTYEETKNFIYAQKFQQDEFSEIEKIFEQKKQEDSVATIMVYGVYNSGKSTLINALLGKELAAVEDIPKTDCVDSYRWEQYDILDTPGVDAPIEHENITKEQMLTADAIIFVVNPIGAAEELKTYKVLIDLLQKDKKVYLVLNEKNDFSDNAFVSLKNDIRKRLQEYAKEKGMSEILKDIPIIKVNAKRALTGKLNNKLVLFEKSGFPDFEKQLIDFLQDISPQEIYQRLKTEMCQFLEKSTETLQNASQNDLLKKYSGLLKNLESEKAKVRNNLQKEIQYSRLSIVDTSKRILHSQTGDSESIIQQCIEEQTQRVTDIFNDNVQLFAQKLESELDALQASVPNLNASNNIVVGDVLSKEEITVLDENNSQDFLETAQEVQIAVQQVAKPEHISITLQTIKKVLPGLMGGIGAKTIEKWAEMVVGKAIPAVGVVLSLASSILGGDDDEKQLRNQIEEQRQAEERFIQQLTDTAEDIGNQFGQNITKAIHEAVEQYFGVIFDQIKTLQDPLSDDEKLNNERLTKLSALLELIKRA